MAFSFAVELPPEAGTLSGKGRELVSGRRTTSRHVVELTDRSWADYFRDQDVVEEAH